MWRWGYLVWRAWIWARVAAPAVLVLWLLHRAYGPTTELWAGALFLSGVAVGTGFVLRDLARREFGRVGRSRR